MPNRELGIFLNSTAGFWVICTALLILLYAGRFVLKRFIGKEYLGQALVITAIVLITAVFFALSFWFPIRGEVSAAVIPRLWIACIIACCVFLAARILRKTEDPDPAVRDLSLPFKFMGLTIAYLVLIVLSGYFIASVIFIAVAMTLLSYRRRLVILSISGGWLAFSYLVFYRVLFVPLPRGLLITMLFG